MNKQVFLTLFSCLLVAETFADNAISKAAETHNQKAVARQLNSIHYPTKKQQLTLDEMVYLSPSEIRGGS